MRRHEAARVTSTERRMDPAYLLKLLLLILGFGFVIFWHELGHFLAAKWAGVKVEQFAIGFGPAICGWRQGIGWRLGSTNSEYQHRVQSSIEERRAAEQRPLDTRQEVPDYEASRIASQLGM